MKKRKDKGVIPWKELVELLFLLLKMFLGDGIKNKIARAVLVGVVSAIGGYTGSKPIIDSIPELVLMLEEE